MPRKRTGSYTSQVDVRAAVRAKWQEKADRYGLLPGAPWPRQLAALDAGKTVPVNGTDLHDTGAGVDRNGRYLLHPDGTVTRDAVMS